MFLKKYLLHQEIVYLGISFKQMANFLGISPYYSKVILNNRRGITLNNFILISAFTGLSLDQLIHENDVKIRNYNFLFNKILTERELQFIKKFLNYLGERELNDELLFFIINLIEFLFSEQYYDKKENKKCIIDFHNINYRIKNYRLINNLDQKKLAEILDISCGYLSSVEGLKRNFSIYNLNKVANFFQVTLDELVLGKQNFNFDFEKETVLFSENIKKSIVKIAVLLNTYMIPEQSFIFIEQCINSTDTLFK